MKWLKRLLGAGILAGAAYALWRAVEDRRTDDGLEWRPQPFPAPPMPVPTGAGDATPGVDEVPAPADPEAVPEPVPATEPGAGAMNEPAPTAEPAAGAAWVAPEGDACPTSHPVKAKLSSGIFHVPDGQMYERTIPDRCYRDPDAAAADGLRASKR